MVEECRFCLFLGQIEKKEILNLNPKESKICYAPALALSKEGIDR